MWGGAAAANERKFMLSLSVTMNFNFTKKKNVKRPRDARRPLA